MSRAEDMLIALATGGATDIVPRSRLEKYLKNCIEGCGCDGLPAPKSRAEILLYALAEKIAAGGGSTGGKSKLVQVADGTITEIKAEDLEGAKSITVPLFQYNFKIVSADIAEGVESILNDVFNTCIALENVVLPSSLVSIAYNTFATCRSLKSVKIKATTPPTIQNNSFTSIPDDCVFTVPIGSGDAYKSATNWSAFADQIVEGDV